MQKRIALIRQGEYFDHNRLNEIIQAVNSSIIEQPQYEQMMNDLVSVANNYTAKVDAFLMRYGAVIDQMPSMIEVLKAIEALQPDNGESSVIDSYIASSINLDFVYNSATIDGIDAGCFIFDDTNNTVSTPNMKVGSGKCVIAQSLQNKEKHVFINTAEQPKLTLGESIDYIEPRWLALDVIVGPQGQIGPQGAIGPRGNDGVDGKDGILVTLMGSVEQTEDEKEQNEAEAEKSMLNRLELKMFTDIIKNNFKYLVPNTTANNIIVRANPETDYPYIVTYTTTVNGEEQVITKKISKDIIFGYTNEDNQFIDGYATKATGYGYVYKANNEKTNIYVFSKDVTITQSNCGKEHWVVLPSIQGPQGPQGPPSFLGVHGNWNNNLPSNIKDWKDEYVGTMSDNKAEDYEDYTHIAIRVGDGNYKNFRIQAREIRYIFGLEWTRNKTEESSFTEPVLNNRYNTYKTYSVSLRLKDYVTIGKDSVKLNGTELSLSGIYANSKNSDGSEIRSSEISKVDLKNIFDKSLNETSETGVTNKVITENFKDVRAKKADLSYVKEREKYIKETFVPDKCNEVYTSATDYTDDEITTLRGGYTGTINAINDSVVTLGGQLATTSKAGLMSAADKTKLDGIAAQANKYVLPVAGSALGGIKTGYANNGKNYKVQVDTSGNAFVNVPWTDTNTTYAAMTAATASAAGKTGLVPAPAAGTQGKFLRGDATWADVPETYVHPTSAGNKHIPAGGAAGQILGYDSAGTAKWITNIPRTFNSMQSGIVPMSDGNSEHFLSATGKWLKPTPDVTQQVKTVVGSMRFVISSNSIITSIRDDGTAYINLELLDGARYIDMSSATSAKTAYYINGNTSSMDSEFDTGSTIAIIIVLLDENNNFLSIDLCSIAFNNYTPTIINYMGEPVIKIMANNNTIRGYNLKPEGKVKKILLYHTYSIKIH